MKKKTFVQKLRNMGPAAIITSAFIGPGTITTATIAGVNFGYSLLWAIVFSIISLISLMEMSSRIGIISGKDLLDASIATFPENKRWKIFIQALVFISVLSVCFGFQAGNLVGSSLALADIFSTPQWVAAFIMGLIALITAIAGSYKVLEKIMLMFVSLMGVLFFVTMLTVRPSLTGILKGIFVPSVPEGALINTIALIGTTLIGINLILHSITSKEKWNKEEDLEDARFDIYVNILIGGVITLSILITSATVLYKSGLEVTSPLMFSLQLEPILGSWARIIGDIGLLSAGLSSAIAVPFTLKSIISKLFHWEGGINNNKAKILGAIVVAFGTFLAMTNTKPTQIIIFAQATSGFFLPFVAILLMIVSNNKKLLGKHTNTVFQNVLGSIAVMVTLGLGSWGLYGVFSKLFG